MRRGRGRSAATLVRSVFAQPSTDCRADVGTWARGRLFDEKPEGEPEQNEDVGVRQVSTGFFQPRGATGFDRRLYRARRPKADT